MKTKTNLLGILIPIIAVVLINTSGCGSAGPEFKSKEQYEKGQFEPGWYYDGMSADEMKKYIDGMTDSEARILALQLYKEKFILPSTIKTNADSAAFEFGTIAVSNEISKNIKIGADWLEFNEEITLTEIQKQKINNDASSGLMDYNWVVAKKSVIYPKLIPGKYKTWFMWNNEKKYSKNILTVGLQTSWFIDREVNGTILVQR